MLVFKACIMVPVCAECNGPNDVCADYLFVQARDVRTNEVVAIKKMSYNGKQSNEVRQDRLCCSLQLKVTLNLKKNTLALSAPSLFRSKLTTTTGVLNSEGWLCTRELSCVASAASHWPVVLIRRPSFFSPIRHLTQIFEFSNKACIFRDA